jgi:hypothetical protein
MALPVAALITSFLSHYRVAKEVVYHSVYDNPSEPPDGDDDAAHRTDTP